ncbi:non-specific lipid-transfer protein isoform X2 [Sarcophilus harrisii]|uniref:non-specific lipid-transfer protein isoform X2 n=1 Tax=Sarcophilus harrisii TaxID=9305 RepID=UPI001301F899|nr:non-specific lipid-transfer protein isoform X2 [Sarcophilus harrisii]
MTAALRMQNTGSRRVFVVGVGMTKFQKPGLQDSLDYPDLAKEAGLKALTDARVSYSDVEQACVGYVYGESTSGQRAIYHSLGLTGIPIFNVNNNCSTGSTALYMARQLIQGGLANCVLALGFEKMEKGSLAFKFVDRANPMDKHVEVMVDKYGLSSAPVAAQLFGCAGKEHMEKYGTKIEHFAKIAWKNHSHSVNNPYSQFQEKYNLEEVMNSRKVFDYLTILQCCPTSDGAAAAILASESFVIQHNLQSQAVEIVAQEMVTDRLSTFQEDSMIKVVGFDLSKEAARRCYEKSGLKPKDVNVIELHDCFSANELITYEALGLCAEGKAGELIDRGDNTYGGKWVINPSGGLISKGHPLGATVLDLLLASAPLRVSSCLSGLSFPEHWVLPTSAAWFWPPSFSLPWPASAPDFTQGLYAVGSGLRLPGAPPSLLSGPRILCLSLRLRVMVSLVPQHPLGAHPCPTPGLL